MRYVIIGNSAAAIGAIEGIRQLDKEGSITIISGEAHHTYSRPLISYLLSGKTDRQRMKYRKDSFYEEMNCHTVFGKTAVKIESDKKQVLLDDGTALPYDKLLTATGSSPFVPPMQGIDTVQKRFTFMSLDDAEKLLESLQPDSRIFIIGAGLIGLKCAEGIAKKVKSVKVVDLAACVLSSILDQEGAQIVQAHLEKNGIEFLLNTKVAAFQGNHAALSDGSSVDFDALVVAVGVRPNISLIKDAGGQTERGIITDTFQRTGLPDVYAAGDCTESCDLTSGENKILALLPNAYMQGECAGIHMAGGEKPYDKAIAMNAIGFFGLHIITAGRYEGELHQSPNGVYKKLFVKDGLLQGFMLMGDIEKAGIYTSLIRERTPLASIDFELIKENPGLMAFSRTERSRKLGGVN